MGSLPERLEKTDKKLKRALAYCLLTGLFIVAFVLLVYYKKFLSQHWDKPVPVDVYEHFIAGTRAVVYIVLPAVSAGYFLVGYMIWHYRRKRDATTE